MGGEAIEVVFPEAPVAVEPPRRAAQRPGGEAHAANPPVAPPLHEPGALEHDEVLADRGERHREGARQLADGGLAGRQARHDRAARRVGQRAEHHVEGRV